MSHKEYQNLQVISSSWDGQPLPFGHNRHGPKIGGLCPLFGQGNWVSIQRNVARAEAYVHAKFHLDPSNHLATIHQRYRQTGQRDRQRSNSTEQTILQMVAQKSSGPLKNPLWTCKIHPPTKKIHLLKAAGNSHYDRVLITCISVWLINQQKQPLLPSGLRTDSTDLITRPSLLSISFFSLVLFTTSSVFFGSVWQIKLATSQLFGAWKYSLS